MIPWTAAHQTPLSSLCLLEFAQFMSIKLVVLSNHLILCCVCLLLPSIFPSIGLCQRAGLRIRWPKYWNFRISPSNEYLGLISFRIDWFDLLAVQETLKRVFSSTTVWKHQFFGAQSSLWSNYYIHSWLLKKNKILTIWTFMGKVMSLLFHRLSKFVIAFLPRSKFHFSMI